MVHELRIYTLLPGKRDEFVVAFEKYLPLFERNGMKVIGCWTTLIGRAEIFYYILEHKSLADSEANWQKLFQDRDIPKLREETRAVFLIQHQDSAFLQPTSYSPLR